MDLKNKFIKKILMLIALIIFSVNLYAEDKEDKFKSMYPDFYETPTRFIIVVNHCNCKLICDNVSYYEINKETNKFLKLKGKTINSIYTSDFMGYVFIYKDLHYVMYLLSDPALTIQKENESKGYDYILDEPIIIFSNKPIL